MIPVFKIDRIKKGLSNFEKIRTRALSRALSNLQPRGTQQLLNEETHFRISLGDYVILNDWHRGVGGFLEKDTNLYYIYRLREEDPPSVFSNKLQFADLPLDVNDAELGEFINHEDKVYEKITFKTGLEIYREEEFTDGHRKYFMNVTPSFGNPSPIRVPLLGTIIPDENTRLLKLSPHQRLMITAVKV